jgi:hypothetical protein
VPGFVLWIGVTPRIATATGTAAGARIGIGAMNGPERLCIPKAVELCFARMVGTPVVSLPRFFLFQESQAPSL